MKPNFLPFFSLTMTFASLWIHRSAWLWGSFLILSFSLAIYTGTTQPFSLLILALLLALFGMLKTPIEGGKRHFLTLTAIILAAGLNFHWIPGFYPWTLLETLQLNFDKPLIGLFPLIFLIPLCQNRADWIKAGLRAIPMTLVAIFGLAWLALEIKIFNWTIKFPSHFLIQAVSGLFLTVIPEEAFFRGFLQREFSQCLGKRFLGTIIGIIGAAIFFALFHLNGNASLAMLAFIFLTGILYGVIYELSRFLEGSVLCHFAVNLLYLLFF